MQIARNTEIARLCIIFIINPPNFAILYNIILRITRVKITGGQNEYIFKKRHVAGVSLRRILSILNSCLLFVFIIY